MRSSLVVVALSLFALPVVADFVGSSLTVDPPAPTSTTPVTLHIVAVVFCPPPPTFVLEGNKIIVAIDPGRCLVSPSVVTYTFPIGVLPAGDYEVVMSSADPSGAPSARTHLGTFFVSDAGAQISILGQSVGPTTGGTVVDIDPAGTVVSGCVSPDAPGCAVPVVTFNGIAAQVVGVIAPYDVAVIAPPNPKGIADVVISGSSVTKHGRVFRYYDPAEGPLESMFERVLVPVWSFGPGAYGSLWTTEVTAFNASYFKYPIEPYRRSPVTLQGKTSVALDFGASRTGGALFFPPRDLAADVEYGSRIRDTSREADDWGTEVPVIHEREFRQASFDLLDVPIDPRLRQTLRIYNVDSFDSWVSVWLYPMGATADSLGYKMVHLVSDNACSVSGPCASDSPAAATVDLLTLFPQLSTQTRLRVHISLESFGRFWAFTTITNNQTQHVTVITPQ